MVGSTQTRAWTTTSWLILHVMLIMTPYWAWYRKHVTIQTRAAWKQTRTCMVILQSAKELGNTYRCIIFASQVRWAMILVELSFQSINRPRTISKSVNQSIGRWVGRSMGRSVSQSFSQPANPSVSEWVSESVSLCKESEMCNDHGRGLNANNQSPPNGQSADRSIESVGQSVDRSVVGQSVSRSVGHSQSFTN